MEDEEKEEMLRIVEEIFREELENGEDMKKYFYFPHDLMTDFMKEEMDVLLIKEAYRCLEEGLISEYQFIPFQDETVTVSLKENEKKTNLLKKMLNFFVSKEEYEKCEKIQHLINFYGN